MSFVISHKKTSQIATHILINSYDLPYYGTKFWNTEQEALAEYKSFLEEVGIKDFEGWHVIEVDEMQMKLFNVKLRNDASLRLFIDEQGKPFVKQV